MLHIALTVVRGSPISPPPPSWDSDFKFRVQSSGLVGEGKDRRRERGHARPRGARIPRTSPALRAPPPVSMATNVKGCSHAYDTAYRRPQVLYTYGLGPHVSTKYTSPTPRAPPPVFERGCQWLQGPFARRRSRLAARPIYALCPRDAPPRAQCRRPDVID